MAESDGSEGKKARLFADVRPALLIWARTSAGFALETAAKKLSLKSQKLAAIEAGEVPPSVPQLRNMARVYKRPLAAFFLPEVPPPVPPIHDFRRLSGDLDTTEASPSLLLELRRARRRRSVALDLFQDLDARVPVFSLSATRTDSVPDVAGRGRQWTGVELKTQRSWKGEYDALNGWMAALEQRGVLVFQTGNIPLREMRGFSIAERLLPIIVLNGKDRPRGRVFTLMHEFAHLMLRDGGVCDPFRHVARNVSTNAAIETFCNQVAGSILVPREALESDPIYRSKKPQDQWDDFAIRELADRFNVSREVIVLRLLHANRVSEQFVAEKLEQYHDEYRAIEAAKAERPRDPKARGLPPYKAALRENGRQYVRLVFDALDRDRISLADASDYLGLRVQHFDKLGNAVGDAGEVS